MKIHPVRKYVGEPADASTSKNSSNASAISFSERFESQFYGLSQMDRSVPWKRCAKPSFRALQEGDLLPEDAMSEELRKMLQDPAAMNSQAVKDLLDKLTERLANEGFINPQQPPQVTPRRTHPRAASSASRNERQPEARFEITDKTIDFLGFKTLQDLPRLGRPQ